MAARPAATELAPKIMAGIPALNKKLPESVADVEAWGKESSVELSGREEARKSEN
jgi:hypothetical protein